MSTKTRSLSMMTLLGAALLLPLPASQADVEKSQSANGGTVTRIRTNGRIASVILADGDTRGFLLASRDLVSGTSALDFSYAAYNDNRDSVYLWLGAGEIPNSAFTNGPNWSSARLAVTTSFPVTRWEINLVTGQVTSAPWPPVTFDLTWAPDDFWTSFERVESIATFGPVKQHFRGAFSRVSASVSGTWDGHPLMNGSGELQDTQNNTIERQIIVEPNP